MRKSKQKRRRAFATTYGRVRKNYNKVSMTSGGRMGGGKFPPSPSRDWGDWDHPLDEQAWRDSKLAHISQTAHNFRKYMNKELFKYRDSIASAIKATPGNSNRSDESIMNEATYRVRKEFGPRLRAYDERVRAEKKKIRYMPIREINKPKTGENMEREPKIYANTKTSAANDFYNKGKRVGEKGFATSAGPTLAEPNPQPVSPVGVGSATKKIVFANDSASPKKIEKIKFQTGHKPTRSLLIDAKRNGSYHSTILDSKINYVEKDYRSLLTASCGFNSRVFLLPVKESQFRLKDIMEQVFESEYDVSAPGKNVELDYIEGTRYGSLLSTKTQFMIHNQSAYLPMNFTVHLCQLKNSAPLANSNVNDWMYSNVPNSLASTQERGRVISRYQHSDRQKEEVGLPGSTDTETVHWDHSLKGSGLYSSNNFNSAVHIVHSTSRRVEAGDFLNISHEHTYGPGVDLGLLASQVGELGLGDLPSSFFVIFEVKGYTCVANERKDVSGETTYIEVIGTNPCYFNYEFKKSYSAVSVDASSSAVGPYAIQRKPKIRDFVRNIDEQSTVTKEYFKLATNIKTTAEVPGDIEIPVTSHADLTTHTVIGRPRSSEKGDESN